MLTQVKHMSNDAMACVWIYPNLSETIRIYPGPPDIQRANRWFLDSALAAKNPPECQRIGTLGTVFKKNQEPIQHTANSA